MAKSFSRADSGKGNYTGVAWLQQPNYRQIRRTEKQANALFIQVM
jgi:hypothetical protein